MLSRGMGMSVIPSPTHKIKLECGLVQGEVEVALRTALPVAGVDVILGNEHAGGRVWADVSQPPLLNHVCTSKPTNGSMSNAKVKMKRSFGRRSERRNFRPGDQVLALLPFQTQLTGPYTVVERMSEVNYLISTSKFQKGTRLCHVTLLRPCEGR